jgi:hypothetical protein
MMQLDNRRAWVAFAPSAATTRTGGGQRTREGVEMTAVFVHEVSRLRTPTARGGSVREMAAEAGRSDRRVGANGRLPRPTVSRCRGATFVVASGA